MPSKLLPWVALLSFLAIAAIGPSAAVAETSYGGSGWQSELARQIEVLHRVGLSDKEIRGWLAKNPNKKIRIPQEIWFWRSELAKQIEVLHGAGVSDQKIRNWLVKHPTEQIPQEVLDWLAKHPIMKVRPRPPVRLLSNSR